MPLTPLVSEPWYFTVRPCVSHLSCYATLSTGFCMDLIQMINVLCVWVTRLGHFYSRNVTNYDDSENWGNQVKPIKKWHSPHWLKAQRLIKKKSQYKIEKQLQSKHSNRQSEGRVNWAVMEEDWKRWSARWKRRRQLGWSRELHHTSPQGCNQSSSNLVHTAYRTTGSHDPQTFTMWLTGKERDRPCLPANVF